jgi:ABC-type lipoprotein export system ATPase subunit
MIAELQNITKDYTQGRPVTGSPVLDCISLAIGERDTIAVTGPSGSGKTTLLNILGTLDRPSSGKVFLDGKEVWNMEEKTLAEIRNRFIGFIFQLHYLLPQLSILENVLLPTLPVRESAFKVTAMERALMLLERVGLQNHLKNFPSTLSVGECQRTAVVRALINQPKLLLADEPTGSLDAGNAGKLTDLLTELQQEQGFAMVIVTHSPVIAGKMKIMYRLGSGNLFRE